jgi:signal transduction histidine kinase
VEGRATSDANEESDVTSLCRSIAEASPMPMTAVRGANHIVCYANPAFCRLVSRAKEELLGKAFSYLVPAGIECLALLERVYRTGKAENHTGQEPSAPHPLYWSYAMWPVLGTADLIIGILIQVTKGTLLHEQAISMNQALMIGSLRQHELTERAEELNVKLEAEIIERKQVEKDLQRANKDLSQYAFASSHDLQEPLRTINIYSQLLIKHCGAEMDADARLYMQYIAEGTKRLRNLLADLLSYARAGADEREPAEFVDFNVVCDRAREHLRAAIADSGAVVSCDKLPVVYGRTAHFVQLMQNLISNAIKYCGEKVPHVGISAERLNGEWRFAVADNGIGIPREYQQEIFGVFKRLHGRAIPGTGIGLAVCQRVVERYGGRIWVESQVGEGATFYFTLPVNSDGPGSN